MEISEALTKRVAELARLRLSDSEVAQFTSQLRDILGYVEQLQVVDTTSVEPMTQPLAETTQESVFRSDVAEPRTVDEESLERRAYHVPQIL